MAVVALEHEAIHAEYEEGTQFVAQCPSSSSSPTLKAR
jgi:hypothetical protein